MTKNIILGFAIHCLCLLFFNTVTHAQNVISGKVTNKDNGVGIDGVNLTLYSADKENIISYAISKVNGDYKLNYNLSSAHFFLKVSLLGYESQYLPVDKAQNQNLNVVLKQSALDLKEVLIKPPKISVRSDTISYNVDAFKSLQDRTIGDVLKKLPGIDVQPNGTILYNGKPITKFYIEGLNLLDGKYNLATNNLGAKDVSSVEVLENHQPIKALKNEVFSDRAAINLKLKSGSKAKWIGSLDEFLGAKPLLYSSSNVGIKISPNNQNLSVLKANNAGIDLLTDLHPHTLEDLINGKENNINNDDLVSTPLNYPVLGLEKYLFNRTLVGSTNQLVKLKKDYLLKVNLNVVQDYRTHQLNNNTLLYQVDSIPITFTENIFAVEKRTSVEGNFNLNKNIDAYYLNNQLDAKFDFASTTVENTGSNPNVQNLHIPNFYVKNDFNLIKRIEKNSIKINFFNYLSWLPQNLTFSQNLQNNAFQQINLRTLFSHLNFSLGKSVSHFSFNARFGLKLKSQDLVSQIDNFNKLPGDAILNNDIRFSNYTLYGSPQLSYSKNDLTIVAQLPVSLNFLKTNRANQKTLVFFSPSLDFRYKFNPYLSTYFNYSRSNQLGDVENLNTGYIFSTYRSLQLGNSNYFSRQLTNASLGVTFRDPVKAFFLNLSGSVNPTTQNQTAVRGYIDYLTVNNFVAFENTSKNWSVNINMSKGFDFLKTLASFSTSYSSNTLNSLQSNQQITSLNDSYNFTQKTNFSINDRLNFNYQFSYRISNLYVSGKIIQKNVTQLSQLFKLGLVFTSKFNMDVMVDHYFNRINADTKVTSIFPSLNFKYKATKALEINLKGSNLLNEKIYEYTVLNDASYANNQYTLRPVTVFAGIYYSW
ncbi:TonB-dependent receptor [Agrobacterium tumefaciens]|nr:TonB-dependent receptor [Agrobacterium tumefaciens]NTE25293.1 TonB-dependent receptor [Agrobacterium tumefaciens]